MTWREGTLFDGCDHVVPHLYLIIGAVKIGVKGSPRTSFIYQQTAAGYQLTNNGTVLDMQTTQNAANNPVVFAIGMDHQVYVQTATGYALTNGGQVLDMRVTRNAGNAPVVFVIGLDHQVYI